jgi:hypothetical protein
MSNLIPNTRIELSKWYPATTLPTSLQDDPDMQLLQEDYTMLLGIDGHGIVSGFLFNNEYYAHVQRYDDFDDEPIDGYSRTEEINLNLEWETERAYGVTCWMMVPDMPKELPVAEGYEGNYWDAYGGHDDSNKDNDDNEPSHNSLGTLPRGLN